MISLIIPTMAENVPVIMFFLNTVNYPVFFPMLSTLTWDTVRTPRGTWGIYLDHIHPLTPFKICGWGGGVA